MTARRSGLVIAAIAAVGVAIAAYLTVTKLSGGLPVCGPSHGCEDVALSVYSSIFGIPTAAFGLLFSTVVALLGLGWWRLGDRRAVIAAYGLGLFGILFVAYLTYLELFVIHAICVWCVGYGLTVVIGWVVALAAVRASARAA
ncbi:MAG TPA: vitamin K epoxide reductase family protein [Patescibacteria group bacterium]|nr:vitamin K epoxide reductase family protein [Patescibacteria group bacterium]